MKIWTPDDGGTLHPVFRGDTLPDTHLRDARIVDPAYDDFFDRWEGCTFVHPDPIERHTTYEVGYIVVVTPCGLGMLWKARKNKKTGELTAGWTNSMQYSGKWWIQLPKGGLDLAARIRRYWLFALERWETPTSWKTGKPWLHGAMSEGIRNLRPLSEIDDGSAEEEQHVLRRQAEPSRGGSQGSAERSLSNSSA